MKRNTKMFIGLVCSSAFVAGGAILSNSGADVFHAIAADEHVWQHYEGVDPTDTAYGYKEYWTCCDCHDVRFTKPSGSIVEGSTPSTDILSYLGTNPDSRYLGKYGTMNAPTNSVTNWEAPTSGPVRVEFGQSMGSHSGGTLANFRNYQYYDWTDTQTITATYTNPDDLISANKVEFTYYVYHDGSVKADLTVTLSVIDAGNVKTQIDQFVIDKNATGWVDYSNSFDLITIKKFVVETKANYVELTEEQKQINTQMYVDGMKLSSAYAEKGDVEISTTDAAKWSYTAKQSANNKILVGTSPYWEAAEGSGPYLTLRTYQWSDWNPTEAGLTAQYTNDTPKIVNTLNFKYYVNSGTFKASALTLTIKVGGVVIDTLTLTKGVVALDSVIDYTKTFTDILFDELSITTSTNEAKGFSGDSCVFLKEMGAQYK